MLELFSVCMGCSKIKYGVSSNVDCHFYMPFCWKRGLLWKMGMDLKRKILCSNVDCSLQLHGVLLFALTLHEFMALYCGTMENQTKINAMGIPCLWMNDSLPGDASVMAWKPSIFPLHDVSPFTPIYLHLSFFSIFENYDHSL